MCAYICELLVCGDAPLEGEEGGDWAFLWVLWGWRHTAHLSQHLLQVNTVSVLFKGQLVSYLEFDLQGSRALEP